MAKQRLAGDADGPEHDEVRMDLAGGTESTSKGGLGALGRMGVWWGGRGGLNLGSVGRRVG